MATMTLPADTRQQKPRPGAAASAAPACSERLSIWGCLRFAKPIPSAADLNRGEVYYPLHVYVCEQCFLVQLEEYESAENIFSDYAYFSSYSDSWLKHCENYCDKMTDAIRPERAELCGRSGQ